MGALQAFISEHGLFTFVGLGIVFFALAIIRLLTKMFKSSSSDGDTDESPSQIEVTGSTPRNIPSSVRAVADDAVTAAVIMAAITAYMAEQGISEDGFRVVSFKRANSGRAWNSK